MQYRDNFNGFSEKLDSYVKKYNEKHNTKYTNTIARFDTEPNNSSTMAAVVLMLIVNEHQTPKVFPHITGMEDYDAIRDAATIDPAMFEPYIMMLLLEDRNTKSTMTIEERRIKMQQQFIRTLSIVKKKHVTVSATVDK